MFGVESSPDESDKDLQYFFDAVVQDVRPQCPANAEYWLKGWFRRQGRTYREIAFVENNMPSAISTLALEVGLSRRLVDCTRVNGMMVGYEIWECALEQFDFAEIRSTGGSPV